VWGFAHLPTDRRVLKRAAKGKPATAARNPNWALAVYFKSSVAVPLALSKSPTTAGMVKPAG
jgi:hypothetical protein